MKYPNKPADLRINYKVNIYEKIEEIFDLREGEQPLLHLLLALMGYKNGKKVDLSESDGKSDKPHEFSLRTVYPRNESDLDAAYGLLSILDNIDLTYEEVINKIAFERTSNNNTQFLKMTNVKTFYEYMLSGIDYFESTFFSDGKSSIRIAENIHDFLFNDQSDIEDLIVELIMTEESEE
jgi:hypothetical protein